MPGGWVLVREGWPDTATRDVVMRRFLGKPERALYLDRTPNAQRPWLLGRVAAKDAARRLGCATGATAPLFPIEVAVDQRRARPPSVHHTARPRPPGVDRPHPGLGVAIVGDGVDVGIDVEVVEPRSATFEATALTADEHAPWSRPIDPDRDTALTTLWAAKEAAAKAAGTGLQGRPRDFPITEVIVDGSAPGAWARARAPVLRVSDRLATDRSALAAPGPDPKEHIVAWTTSTASPPVLADVEAMLTEIIGEDFLIGEDVTPDTSFDRGPRSCESIEFVALAEQLARALRRAGRLRRAGSPAWSSTRSSPSRSARSCDFVVDAADG